MWSHGVVMNGEKSNTLEVVFSLLEDYERQLDCAVERGEIDVCKKWELIRRKREDLLIEESEARPQYRPERCNS